MLSEALPERPQTHTREEPRVMLTISIAAVLALVWFGFLDLMQEAADAGLGCLPWLAICVIAGICSGLTGC